MKILPNHQHLKTPNTTEFPWLTEERDACGVGLIADVNGTGSHQLVEQALTALGCMEHRGGCSADNDSGDGSGVMTAIPREILAPWFAQHNLTLPPEQHFGVGMVFLPPDAQQRADAKLHIEEVVQGQKLTILGWRDVPVRPEVLGQQARDNQPHIAQIIVTSPEGATGCELDRVLYIARSRVGKLLADDFISAPSLVEQLFIRGW